MRAPFPSRPGRALLALFVVLLALPSLPAYAAGAAESAPTRESLQNQIDQLQRDLKRLERANTAIEPMVDEKINKQWVTAGFNLKDGFFIQDPTKEYRLRIGGYTQLDGRFFVDDSAEKNTDQFLFRRVRPTLEGSLTRFIDFKIMPDFAAGTTVALYDAYVDIKPFDEYRDWAKLRVGKFKAPVGLERWQSAAALPLVERGAPTNLVPTRDVGIQVWGSPWAGTILYELGVFDGAPDSGNINGNLGDDFTFAGRVFAQPFATWPAEGGDLSPLRGLGVGVAGSWGDVQGNVSSTDLPAYKSFGQATIFQYVNGGDANNTAVSNGTLSRINPQGYYYWGPFSSQAEYVWSSTPVQLGDVNENIANKAWELEAGWVLTGEDASFRGVTPTNPFNPWNGNWGALEVVGRYDDLEIDNAAFQLGFADAKKSVRESEGFGGGLNWYWNRNIKISLDYYHTWFKKGASTGTLNRPTEDVFIARLQLLL